MPILETLLPAVVGGIAQLVGGESANAASARSVKAQQDFQERMSSTQYQRTTADMRAAGLNPMLAAFSGSVDSSPSGASYSAQNVASGFAGVGAQVGSQVQQQPNVEADTSLTKAKEEAQHLTNLLTKAQKQLTSANARISGYEGDMLEPVASFVKEMTPDAVRYFKENMWPSFKRGISQAASSGSSFAVKLYRLFSED